MNTSLAQNPLIAAWVGELRDPACGTARFRQLLTKISTQLAVEAATHLQFVDGIGNGPFGEVTVTRAAGRAPVIVPVLRAGLAMSGAVAEVLENCPIALVGVARNEATLAASFYLEAGPQVAGRTAVICDPMLATGASLIAVGEHLESLGVTGVVICAVLAAPEGLDAVRGTHPNWQVITACVDDHLDNRGYIVPGLGDAGDRWSGLERPW